MESIKFFLKNGAFFLNNVNSSWKIENSLQNLENIPKQMNAYNFQLFFSFHFIE